MINNIYGASIKNIFINAYTSCVKMGYIYYIIATLNIPS